MKILNKSVEKSLATSLLIGLFISNVSCAAENAGEAKGPNVEDLTSHWKVVLDGTPITAVKPSAMDGLWEVQAGGHVFYTNQSGDKLIIGDMLMMRDGQPVNLTEEERQGERAALLKTLNPKDFITFAAKDPKHTIYVFTDADCGYCRKFHEQRQELMDNGITINYLAMPRTPEGTPSYNKAVSIWCAKDRQAAMTEAKEDKLKDTNELCDDGKRIVAQDVALATSFGARGTPTIILQNGEIIPGFIPAENLIEYFNATKK